MKLLEIDRLTKDFGGLRAVDKLDITIEAGMIFGLIGPNGAGKSTAFNCVAGLYSATSGRVLYKDDDITHLKPYDVCRRGIVRTFQLVKPFPTKSVLKNVTVGGFLRSKNRNEAEEKALEVLEFVGLMDKKDVLGKSLTIADRKRLELARALATEPTLLLLDEVMAGLRPAEVEQVITIIRKINERGITIFLIEHIMQAIMSLSDLIVVIHYGKKIAEGQPEEIASNEQVIKAYLGEEYVLAGS
ncbi:MAG: ABC transporter ATP-binding protein [Desulfatiglandaceae bacterium]